MPADSNALIAPIGRELSRRAVTVMREGEPCDTAANVADLEGRAAISVSRQRRHSPKKSAASSPGTATITVAERPGMAPVTSIVEGAGFTIAEASASAIRFVPRRPLLPGLYDVEIAFASRWLSNVSFDFEYGGDNRAQLRAVPLA